MNHYPRHVGDFNNATRHLTRVERSLYSDMLDLYYDTERPLNSDFEKLARRLLAVSSEERDALQIVLDEFFFLESDGWHNDRCDAEIAKYQGSVEQASRAGKASAARRAASGGGVSAKPSRAVKAKTSNAAEQETDDRSTTVQRPLNDRATNQNQNQNQNQDLTHTMPVQPQYAQSDVLPPDGGVRVGPTMAGAVCVALRAAGVASCSPSSPALAALIDGGATVDLFVAAARDALQKPSKPSNVFAYVLAVVRGQMADATAIAAAGTAQAARAAAAGGESFRERDARLARERWEDLTGRTHPHSAVESGALVVDIAPAVGAELQRIEA